MLPSGGCVGYRVHLSHPKDSALLVSEECCPVRGIQDTSFMGRGVLGSLFPIRQSQPHVRHTECWVMLRLCSAQLVFPAALGWCQFCLLGEETEVWTAHCYQLGVVGHTGTQ